MARGKHRNPRRLLSAPPWKWEEWDASARREGVRWSEWARRRLDGPGLVKVRAVDIRAGRRGSN